jgi:uncharacterized protein YegP (UPF0339 family)
LTGSERSRRITLVCVRCDRVLTAGPADPLRTIPVLCIDCQRADPLLGGSAVKPTVEYYQDEAGHWRWTLRGGNGEVVAQGEGHGSKSDAVRAFERAADLATEAALPDDPPPEAA